MLIFQNLTDDGDEPETNQVFHSFENKDPQEHTDNCLYGEFETTDGDCVCYEQGTNFIGQTFARADDMETYQECQKLCQSQINCEYWSHYSGDERSNTCIRRENRNREMFTRQGKEWLRQDQGSEWDISRTRMKRTNNAMIIYDEEKREFKPEHIGQDWLSCRAPAVRFACESNLQELWKLEDWTTETDTMHCRHVIEHWTLDTLWIVQILPKNPTFPFYIKCSPVHQGIVLLDKYYFSVVQNQFVF